MICFDVHMFDWSASKYDSATDYQWALEDCSSSGKWMGPGTYSKKCCVSAGTHALACKARRTRTDWSKNVVMLMGHRFCEDFVGQETFIALNISGIFRIRHL